ncbi:hypothetical protein ONZ43_g2632 [Nemania bipapillata]|uniref:Uncharacterized protein n=1 Tax=Nemania bipapillata TaxID=110536 RepID=A0ACC2IZS9_9PEZI|nr:hypothetical protein ONZ43_g2632 [Nemania bipapillata]
MSSFTDEDRTRLHPLYRAVMINTGRLLNPRERNEIRGYVAVQYLAARRIIIDWLAFVRCRVDDAHRVIANRDFHFQATMFHTNQLLDINHASDNNIMGFVCASIRLDLATQPEFVATLGVMLNIMNNYNEQRDNNHEHEHDNHGENE